MDFSEKKLQCELAETGSSWGWHHLAPHIIIAFGYFKEKPKYDIMRPWLTLDPWQIEYINTDPNQDCFLLSRRQA